MAETKPYSNSFERTVLGKFHDNVNGSITQEFGSDESVL